MKYKQFICILAAILILFICMGCINASQYNTTDELTDGKNAKLGDIQPEIDNSSDNEIIIEIEESNCESYLNIDKNITLQGTSDNSTISLDSVQINSGNLYLKNLKVKPAWSDIIINSTDSNVTLTNCTIELHKMDDLYNPSSTVRGINFKGNSITFINSTFTHIFELNSNGRVTIINSSIMNTNAKIIGETVEVYNSEFINNLPLEEFSGDELIIGQNVQLSNSRFINNTREGDFSTMTLIMAMENLKITSCEFEKNYIRKDNLKEYDSDSNTLIYSNGNTTIYNNVFKNNTCRNLIVWNANEKFLNLFNNILVDNYYNNSLKYSQLSLTSKTKEIHVIPEDKDFDDYYIDIPTSSLNIFNNFFGFNIEKSVELRWLNILTTSGIPINENIITSWINIDLEKNNDNYTLKFVDSTKKIINMPTHYVDIINKETGEKLASNIKIENGTGTFTLDKNISIDDILICNYNASIINKPKADLNISLIGKKQEDMYFIVKLNNFTNDEEDIYSQQTDINFESYTGFSFNKKDGGIEIPFDSVVSIYAGFTSYNVIFYFVNQKCALTSVEFKNIIPLITHVTIKLKPITTTYGTKTKLDGVSMSPKSDKISFGTNLKIFKGKKEVYCTGLGFYNGIKSYPKYLKLPKLAVGTYTLVTESNLNGFLQYEQATTTLKINKAPTTVKAPKVTNKYKKSKYFKVTVKAYEKPVKNLALKVKVGKKTFKIKTNENGIAKLNTKSLKIGTYKVVISSGNANYKVSAKSTIKIKR